jgi:hypothetical protein
MFPLASRLGWGFPGFKHTMGHKGVLGLGLFGQFKDEELGNWQDHEFIDGTPIFSGWNAIDLKASPSFRVKFSYPTTVDILWMFPAAMGGDTILSKRTMVFRKGQMFYYSPARKVAWTAYPGAGKIWAVQTGPTKKRY